ncbi:MAG TPA: ribosome maturation factor RimM [Erysipelotrichaceae bacterium]|nr:ribosome maturation factor RimM [Erysipelotrichaceae bacterium]
MEYVRVGNIVNTFGIKGELKVKSHSDFDDIRFKVSQQLYVKYLEVFEPVVVKSYRTHKGFILISFFDKQDINLVEKYKGCDIFIKKDDVHTLSEGVYYFFELENCSVYYNNQKIGYVSAVEDGYQTILRIDMENKEVLIPFVDRFIKEVNVSDKRIDIDIIEGLL